MGNADISPDGRNILNWFKHNYKNINSFPTVFNHPEFGELRTVEIDNEVWFVGKDVATALGYAKTENAIARHVASEDKKLIQRSEITTLEIPNRGMIIINESGLYSLILSSKLPSAREFKHWVTSEVLPMIRKTGGYVNSSQVIYSMLIHEYFLKYACISTKFKSTIF